MILLRIMKSVIKLGCYCIALLAVFGVWDFVQQAKASEAEYSFEQYLPSVPVRYEAEIQIASDVFGMAKAGVSSGIESGLIWAHDTGLFEKIGLEVARPVEPVAPVELKTLPELEALAEQETSLEPVLVAAVQEHVAPESSLFPRARATH